jgi:hypothetical protein
VRGTVDLRFSQQAADDLRRFGFLDRRLIPQVIRDQLVAASRPEVEPLDDTSVNRLVPPAVKDESIPLWASQDSAAVTSPWLAVRIGDNVAVVRPQRSGETGDFGAFVARIVSKDELKQLVQTTVAADAGMG